MCPGVCRQAGRVIIMKRVISGVPFRGTPIFLLIIFSLFCCLLSAGARFLWAAQFAEPGGNSLPADTTSPQKKVIIFAEQFHYEEVAGNLTAIGNVIVWYADITLTAEAAEAQLETNMVHARGDVVLIEAERKIHCAELDYNLKDRSAQMYGIRFAAYPWYYQGRTIEKQGEDKVTISKASFTTCNARHPHYHLTAEQIDIVLGESLTAHHAIVYVGATPLFYLPWIRRSLKDGRPPFSIRVGYNDFEGFYAKLRLNYFLIEENYGALLLDFMEKKGIGVGLEHHLQYALYGKGVGDFSAWYVKDDEQGVERWTANLSNRHEFSDRDLLQLNLDYLSDRMFNREFSFDLVDTYQQKSYLSYSHRADAYYFSIGVTDVESLDPDIGKYYPSSRELPAVNFSLSARKLVDMSNPIYFSMSSSLTRSYERLQDNNDIYYRYRDNFNISPTLTQTYTFPIRVLTQPSLSGSVSFPISGDYKEDFYPGLTYDASGTRSKLEVAYSTRVTLTNKWVNYRYTKPTHLMQTRISHEFMRKFSLLEEIDLPRAGISNNRLGLAAEYFMGDFLMLQAATGYKLHLLEEKDNWKERMDVLTFNGRASLLQKLSLTGQGQYAWDKDRITSAYLSASTYGKVWNLAFSGAYSYIGTATQEHSVFGTLTAGYKPGIGISLQSVLQYDFIKKEFTNFSLNLSRDLHCWNMQAGFKIYADGKLELGLGLNLKAFPEVRVGMGGPGGVEVGE